VIASTASRNRPIPCDRVAYRPRNPVERMFGGLKDCRRIATRYDQLAGNFLATAALAAIVICWRNCVRTLEEAPRLTSAGAMPILPGFPETGCTPRKRRRCGRTLAPPT
jgi:hypothetical protein